MMGYYDGLPAFRWPQTEEDILRLMQRNDVFIMVRMLNTLHSRRSLVIFALSIMFAVKHGELPTLLEMR